MPTFQPQAQHQIFRLSNGLERHQREEGSFEVRYGSNLKAFFDSLSAATLFYLRYRGAAAIYDVTVGEELIERKIKVDQI